MPESGQNCCTAEFASLVPILMQKSLSNEVCLVGDELAMSKRDARRIQELVDGMSGGDPRAMEAFFTFVDGLLKKKLDRDGEDALMVVVSVVELLLPMHARSAFAAESEKGVKKPAQPRKRTPKKKADRPAKEMAPTNRQGPRR
jgi:hypothetical protein